MLDALGRLPASLGRIDSAAMDHGYFSAANVQACLDRNIEPLIALGREAHQLRLDQRFGPDAPEPDTNDPAIRMAWRLKI